MSIECRRRHHAAALVDQHLNTHPSLYAHLLSERRIRRLRQRNRLTCDYSFANDPRHLWRLGRWRWLSDFHELARRNDLSAAAGRSSRSTATARGVAVRPMRIEDRKSTRL